MEPHPVKTAVEGLKRYGKKIVMSYLRVQVEGTYKKCSTL